MSDRHSTYRVPTKRPLLLAELARRLPGIDDRIRNLDELGDPTEYDAIADHLWNVFLTARNLAPQRPRTGCTLHPEGPLDPEAPAGQPRCLLCSTRRQRAGTTRPQPPRGQPDSPPQGYPVPDPPYSHMALRHTMRQINELHAELTYRSTSEQFTDMADALHRAFVIARELARPRTASTCPKHPGAPIDPAASESPPCLFCSTEEARRRLASTDQTTRQESSPPECRSAVGYGKHSLRVRLRPYSDS